MLTPTLRKSLSKSSLSGTSPPSTASLAPSSSSTLTVNTTLEPSKALPSVPDSGSLSAIPMLQAANAAALMERTPFAIDNANDEDEDDDDDDDTVGADDDQVLDEVNFVV